MVGVEVLAPDAEEEAVEDRRERLVGGDLVRGAEARQERARDDGAAARVAALVQEREQRVQDGRVALEDLVEEDDLGVRQHPLDAPLVAPLAERGDVDRAEDLVRLGEAREEVLEVAARRCRRANVRTSALFAVPGGPTRTACSPGDDAR